MRSDIITEVERARAAWSAYTLKVEYPNKDLINLAEQTDPYLAVDLVFFGARQMDLGLQPFTRHTGRILFAAGVKEGAGQLAAVKLLDHLHPYFHLRHDLGVVRTAEAQAGGFRKAMGWHFELLTVSFWSDTDFVAVP